MTNECVYAGDGVSLSTNGVLTPPSSLLLSETASQYNALGQVYQSTVYPVVNGNVGAAQITSTWYDLDGNEIESQDPLGNDTYYALDGSGQQTTVTQPAVNGVSPVTTTVYDPDNNATATIDPLGRVTATSFDTAGRQIAGYAGQILPGSNATFGNLSPGPSLSYDVYVSASADLTQGHYTLTGGSFAQTTDPTAPTIAGYGLSLLGTVTLSSPPFRRW